MTTVIALPQAVWNELRQRGSKGGRRGGEEALIGHSSTSGKTKTSDSRSTFRNAVRSARKRIDAMSLGRLQDAAAAAAADAGASDVDNVEAASSSSHTPNRSPRFRSMINLSRSSPRSREAQIEEPSAWELVRRSRAEYEAVALALFPSLPYELQLHIFSFIPIRDLTKTMSCASRYYAAMHDRYVRGSIQTIFSERASSTDKSQSRGSHHRERSSAAATSRLIFEAQRPIDTLTTKHFLHFSHLGPPDDSRSDGCTGTYAHFTFVRADADASSTSKRLELDRGAQASSTAASPWRRVAPAGYPAQLSVPQVPLEHRDRLTSRDITSSVSSPSATASVARALPDSPPRAPLTQVLPLSSSARGMGFTDVATPYERFSAARLVSDDEDADETASVGGVGNQEEEEHGSTARVVPGAGGSTWIRGANDHLHPAGQDLNRPLDAYDWSGPISSSLDSRSPFDARQSRRSQPTMPATMPTYQFQLDPLDSFESWCLSLTLQRKREDVDVPGRPAMRWEKRLAEGLDRVFREWFVPPPASQEASGQTALARAHAIHDGFAGQSTSLEEEARAEQEEEAAAAAATAAPRPRALEFDGPSCVVWIQPHAHKNLTSHPALSQAYSHSYLSYASLSSSSSSSRVTLTFNASSIRINAARLLACAQDVEDDIRNAHRMASAGGARILAGSSGGSSWAHATGGSNYFANQTGVTVLALSGFR
ncbi:hypothetical protein IE81DRAFT_349603 [Ceraceosorus guamensis]|uniref:F-box domain-containing protein n=1 Tax=Ceraceosorus guamensis TaxID=1522189 RepID=A0A316VX43_9BASI|nr:hypothetical protein IE81DRAFT_349603 [Ceraceosorus guamensis]PWN40045.1 hypothetical protein IE81DRAFT_349603 [Ceraceosorus guamensis]